MSSEMEKSRVGWRVGSRILLAVSLALNLLVIGLAAGAALRWGGLERAERPPPSVGAALYRALPRVDRDEVRAVMKARHGSRAGQRRDDARNLAEALRASPFVPETVESILAGQDARRDQWQAAVQAAWMQQVRAMDDAERTSYAERLEQVMTRARGKNNDRDRPGK